MSFITVTSRTVINHYLLLGILNNLQTDQKCSITAEGKPDVWFTYKGRDQNNDHILEVHDV